MFLSRESGGFEESIDGYNGFSSPSVNPTYIAVCAQSSRGYSSPKSHPIHPQCVPSAESTAASDGSDYKCIHKEANRT